MRCLDARELVREARFADARLPDDPDHLSVPPGCLRHAIAHELEIGVATNEPAQRAAAQSEPGGLASRQAPEWDRVVHRCRTDLEPAFEKRRCRLADDNRVELIEPGQRFDRRPGRPLALQIDGGSALILTHQDLWRAEQQADDDADGPEAMREKVTETILSRHEEPKALLAPLLSLLDIVVDV